MPGDLKLKLRDFRRFDDENHRYSDNTIASVVAAISTSAVILPPVRPRETEYLTFDGTCKEINLSLKLIVSMQMFVYESFLKNIKRKRIDHGFSGNLRKWPSNILYLLKWHLLFSKLQ